jgi:hypothetical protein
MRGVMSAIRCSGHAVGHISRETAARLLLSIVEQINSRVKLKWPGSLVIVAGRLLEVPSERAGRQNSPTKADSDIKAGARG